MKKTLISFGSNGYEKTLEKLSESSKQFFDDVIIYNEKDIEELKNKYPQHFYNGRGYGYWLWKPYLILKTLNNMSEGDALMYCDATTHFINDPHPLMELTNLQDVVVFSTEYTNKQFTKYDTFYGMECLSDEYSNGKHANAAFLIIKKTDNSIGVMNQYFKYCCDYNIVSDSININGKNFTEFIDHRHDQSILSLLTIKNGLNFFRDPSQWGEKHIVSFTNSNYGVILNHHRNKY